MFLNSLKACSFSVLACIPCWLPLVPATVFVGEGRSKGCNLQLS